MARKHEGVQRDAKVVSIEGAMEAFKAAQWYAEMASFMVWISPAWAAVLYLEAYAFYELGQSLLRQGNDPPRDDFDVFSLVEAQYDVQPTLDDRGRVWQAHAAYVFLLTDAHQRLLLSIERYHGAEQGGAKATRLVDLQVEAIRHNADVSARLQEEIVRLSPQANITAYETLRDAEAAGHEPSVEELRRVVVGSPAEGLELIRATIRSDFNEDLLQPPSDFLDAIDVRGRRPDLLVSDGVYGYLKKSTSLLRKLVVPVAIQ
jgi:hypothetical protein